MEHFQPGREGRQCEQGRAQRTAVMVIGGEGITATADALCAFWYVNGNVSMDSPRLWHSEALPSTSPCTEFISIPLFISLLKIGFI